MSADPGGSWGVVLDPYVPPQQGPKFNLPRCGCVTFGTGVPDNSTGDSGDIYVDSVTEIVYQKQGDTYVVLSSGGTILFQGHYGQNPPPLTPSVPLAVARDQDAPNESWWWNGTTWE